MSEIAIKVEGVSKIFRIYDHPTDRIKEVFSLSRKKFHTDYAALKNINFEVKKGEFLGIVGRNGAGKSTLLKILSRELTPTTGHVSVEGAVSLLQLGVGFNPELTGIDNARFASKILGYSDLEIEEMLEDIISFADIGEFIYHPVKTYSSGMYSRLSFAIGININPDILIADEVLSVGDMRFSQKCLRKMHEFKERGKTVIFVSHDIQSVNVFCNNALWIKDGSIFMHGESKYVTTNFQNYMLFDQLPPKTNEDSQEVSRITFEESNEAQNILFNDAMLVSTQELTSEISLLENLTGLPSVGNKAAEITHLTFSLRDSLRRVSTIQGNEWVILKIKIEIRSLIRNPQVGWLIYSRLGLVALHTNNDICGEPLPALKEGDSLSCEFHFKLPSLANGHYSFSIGLQDAEHMSHKIDNVYEFTVQRCDAKSGQCGFVLIEHEAFKYDLKKC